MRDIIPGIYELDMTELMAKLRLVAPLVRFVQIDISDGSLVPKQSVVDFTTLRDAVASDQSLSHLGLEAHLMVANPNRYIKPLVDAGFKRLIAHVECEDPRLFLNEARYESIEAGLAIDGPTDLVQIEPFIEDIDVVLVMMAEAGASGLGIQDENIEKVRTLRSHYPQLSIEVDQGINDKTVKVVSDAGANRFVSTSFIFTHPAAIAQSLHQVETME